jgi:hypothetical protein
MRSQYIKALQQFCERRSRRSSVVRWWFSDFEIPPRRSGASEFEDEHTQPFKCLDPEVETQEDPPLEDEFFQQLGYG